MVHNGLVYVSGQLPIDPVTGQHETGGIEAQTRQVLNNLKRILEASGSSIDRVCKSLFTLPTVRCGATSIAFTLNSSATIVPPEPSYQLLRCIMVC